MSIERSITCLLAAILAVLVCRDAPAAQLQARWVGPYSSGWAASNFWTTTHFPNNGTPPNRTYHAVIDAEGNPYTILLSQDITLDRLTMESPSATLQHSVGTITLVGGPGKDTATRWLAGRHVGSGTFEVHAPFHLVGGSIGGGPQFRIRPSGSLHVYGPEPKTLDRYLRNEGSIDWQEGDVHASQLFNMGTVVANAELGADHIWGSFVENSGTVTKTGGGVSRLSGFENSGTITILDGELLGEAGGSHSGVFEIGPGATLGASGVFEPQSQIAGDRLIVLGDSEFLGMLDIDHLEVEQGDVEFPQPLTLQSMIVRDGQVQTHSGLAADSVSVFGGELWLRGAANSIGEVTLSDFGLYVEAPLEISESLIFSGGVFYGSEAILVQPGATLRFENLWIFDRFTGRVRNEGHAIWANSDFDIGYGWFDNRGELQIDTHTGDFVTTADFPSNPSALNNFGLIRKTGAGLASLPGVTFNNAGTTIVEAGTFELFTHDLAVPTINAGEFISHPGAVVRVYGNLELTPTSTLRVIAGPYGQQTAAGVIFVTRTAMLGGAIVAELEDGFAPAWGDRWELIEYESREGDFSAVSLPPSIDPHLRWRFNQTPKLCEIGLYHIADMDYDGVIGFADLNIVVSNFNAPGSWEQGDADGDGVVGFGDLNLVISNFNTAAPD